MEISISKIKYFFLIAPFLMSTIVFVLINGTFANLILMWKLVAFLYVAVQYLKRGKLSKFCAAVFLYFAVWFLSTLLNGQNIIEYCKEIIVMSFYIFLFENAKWREETDTAVHITSLIIFLELTVNLVCIWIFPNGLWHTTSMYGVETNYYFLGMDNQATPLIIIALFCVVYHYHNNMSRRYLYCYFVVVILNTVLMGSATCIAGFIVFVLFLLLSRVDSKIFNMRTAVLFVIVIYILFVLLRAQKLFEFFIVNVLQRDIGFSARTGIWDGAMRLVSEKPILGYGCKTFATLFKGRHAHNMYLQIMLQSGIVGFVLFLNYVRSVIKKCIHLEYATLCAATILAYGICCMMEVYNQGYLILLLSIYSVLEQREDTFSQ